MEISTCGFLAPVSGSFKLVLSCRTGFTFLLDEKSKQKNQVKIKLYCFSKERLSPIDAILTRPQRGMVEGVRPFVVCGCRSCNCFFCA
jgi:hypothetical protein